MPTKKSESKSKSGKNADPAINPLQRFPGFLVQFKPGLTLRKETLGVASGKFGLTPLLDARTPGNGLALDGDPSSGAWFVAEFSHLSFKDRWDAAYKTLEQMEEIAYVEPDLIHSFPEENESGWLDKNGLSVRGKCEFNDQAGDPRPKGPGFAWHLGDEFSQLRAAREEVGDNPAARVRVAHLDTGYDPEHVTKPVHLLDKLGANFSGFGDPSSGSDPGKGGYFSGALLDNTGHGTGTLGLLAGNRVKFGSEFDDYLGGAPQAEVVPIRVAGSVVLLKTSAFVRAVDHAIKQGCWLLSMSMGGLASRAWAEVVNRAYEAGLLIVSAAGNNVSTGVAGIPIVGSPESIVYPARFDRTIAACGVMANGKPYTRDQLGAGVMAGNFGPPSKMRSAMAAYTPNVPWAEFQCGNIVDMDGSGTSSATPQIAAAAALWLMKHHQEVSKYGEPWMRVEAVRRALFQTAECNSAFERFLGRGILKAKRALTFAPPLVLEKTRADSVSWPFLKLITGMGAVGDARAQGLYEVEMMQLWQRDADLRSIIPDPDSPLPLSRDQVQRFLERLIEGGGSVPSSQALRGFLRGRFAVLTGKSNVRPARAPLADTERVPLTLPDDRSYDPPSRRLRCYAFDPSLATRLETLDINEVTIDVRWEDDLKPGPCGEYIEVIDHDPSSGCYYSPVDLNQKEILAQEGVPPSEGNPHFHQQMAYAVAMRTIENFEAALGRPMLWPARWLGDQAELKGEDTDREEYVQRLRIYPHALRQANAFYSPQKKALLFGYFPDNRSDPSEGYPGGIVFSCLSHDIVAHESTHALLDGMHRRFRDATNPDVLAFHEAFADIVALFQHFSYPEVLSHQIARTRGSLDKQNLLGELAQQFGRATGKRGALRNAIGQPADPAALDRELEPHKRGSLLVAAVFDAYLAIYQRRVADLLRIATGGTGVLPAGELHPDLVNRLANEAAKSARHVLTMSIRALDYCPPVDITFGEYLRALITADFDLVSDDRWGYRVAFVEAFRRRGIYPGGVRTLSVETLRWDYAFKTEFPKHRDAMLTVLKKYADESLYLKNDRKALYLLTRKYARKLHGVLKKAFQADPRFAYELGVDPEDLVSRPFEVHALRRAERSSPDGRRTLPQVVVVLSQKRVLETKGQGALPFRGGATLIVDLYANRISYRILKNIQSVTRLERTLAFLEKRDRGSLRETYFGEDENEPFAMLHGSGC